MKLLVLRETRVGERRVGLTPSHVSKAKSLGYSVAIETGAGEQSGFSDEQYVAASAEVLPATTGSSSKALSDADVVVTVSPIDPTAASHLKKGSVTISFLQKERDLQTVKAITEAGASALSFDYLPRISRAQGADALTSQAIISGYRITLVAANLLPRFFSLYMTAAGTIRPARVLVLGAGVAGLQAMATAKRLGAVVSGYDVRAASPDEIRSVGARFVDIGLPPIDGAGGYARELGEERSIRQRELLTPVVADHNVVLTTAAIPGRPAPLLISAPMIEAMSHGSVICDLAAESGGNVEGSVAGEVISKHGVTIWGGRDVPSQMAPDASALYAGNVLAMLGFITKDGKVELDPNDEVIRDSAVVLAD